MGRITGRFGGGCRSHRVVELLARSAGPTHRSQPQHGSSFGAGWRSGGRGARRAVWWIKSWGFAAHSIQPGTQAAGSQGISPGGWSIKPGPRCSENAKRRRPEGWVARGRGARTDDGASRCPATPIVGVGLTAPKEDLRERYEA